MTNNAAPKPDTDPLLQAVGCNDAEALCRLLDEEANPDKMMPGRIPLLIVAAGYAITFNDLTIVKVLLERGADPKQVAHSGDRMDLNGKDAFGFAALRGHEELMSLLLDYNADINARTNTFMETPLIAAAMRNDVKTLSFLLKNGANKEVKNSVGLTALDLAVHHKHADAVKTLIKAGASVENRLFGQRPVDRALKDWDDEIVLMLARASAHPLPAGVLFCAARANDIGAAGDFIIRSVDVNEKGEGGSTVLGAAAECASPRLLETLLDNDADINLKNDGYEETPLIMAARAGRADNAQLLLKRGARAEEQDTFGMTALMAAAENNDVGMIRTLAEGGAGLSTKGARGYTAFDVAASEGRKEAMQLLAELGAGLDNVSDDGLTPRARAQKNGDEAALRFFETRDRRISDTAEAVRQAEVARQMDALKQRAPRIRPRL